MQCNHRSPVAGCPGCEATFAATSAGRPAPPARWTETPTRGTRVGRYVLLDPIGEGAMGVVFAAFDPELNRQVAVKVVRPALEETTAAAGQLRLLREAQLMAQLSDPHVIPIFDTGPFQTGVFLAMELVEGETLADWMQRGPHPWPEVLGLLQQVGQGLLAAHRAGIVHRDFKPSNVFIGKDGRARVGDFGLARTGDSNPPSPSEPSTPAHELVMGVGPTVVRAPLTEAGFVLGTPGYMAPEQYFAGAATPLADQFSFCVTLYEALYGQRPFSGHSFQALPPQGPPRPLHTVVPAWLHRAVVRGLARESSDRFPSMEALLAALAANPGPPRRGWLIGALAGALALGGVAAAVVLERRATRAAIPECEEARMALSGIWDADARQAVQRAFVATGAFAAADSARDTIRTLDEYAESWTTGQRSACAQLQTAASDEAVHSTLTCLSRQREQLEALVQLLVRADTDVINKASNATNTLLPAGRCADPHVLAALPKAPANPAIRAEVEGLRLTVAAARAKTRLGRAQEACSMLGPVVARARTLAYGPVLAEALFELGNAQAQSDEIGASARSFLESEKSAELASMDILAAEAAAQAGNILGSELARPDEARQWLERARTELDRGGGDALVEATLENLLSDAASREGRGDEALQHMVRAIALSEQAVGPQHPKTVTLLNNLAVQYDLYCRDEEAIAVYRKVVASSEARFGHENKLLALSLVNLAGALVNTGGLDEAERLLDRAWPMTLRYRGPQSSWAAAMYWTRAGLRLEQGRFEDALALAVQTVEAARAGSGEDSTSYAVGLQFKGMALNALGRHAEALPLLQSAAVTFEQAKTADPTSEADALVGVGAAWVGLRQPTKAVIPLERALKMMDARCAMPGQRGWARFVLAQALTGMHGDASRVQALLEQARAELAALPSKAWRVDQIDQWVRARHSGH